MNLEFEGVQPPRVQKQKAVVNTAPRISGGKRKPAWEIKKPTLVRQSAEDNLRQKKLRIAEEEVIADTAGVLTGSVARYGCQDEHGKRFQAACQKSEAVELLVKSNLGFVSAWPSAAQLALVVASKWLQTRIV